MRDIKGIVIHCAATKETSDISVETITKWHKKRGFRTIGYHFYIRKSGRIYPGRMIDEVGAHVQGDNSRTIGICYEGGLDANGKPKDTRTEHQKQSMLVLILTLKNMFPDTTIKGHRDYSPDLNGDGIIEPWEFMKACPCFDVEAEFGDLSK